MVAIQPFFDADTNTYSYVVSDPKSGQAAVIDSVYNYDAVSGRVTSTSADTLAQFIREEKLTLRWILETHAHADHLSAAVYLKETLGGEVCIGRGITAVQDIFADVFNFEADYCRDGSQFDVLFEDGDEILLGEVTIKVMHTPGHTPACVTYLVEDSAFVGDTLFMPDYGTARTDFPGGDAGQLYDSIQRILSLPEQTKLYMCHDYLSGTRTEYRCKTTVAEERHENVHIGSGVSKADFVAMRETRDKDLSAPRLLLPSVQFNIRAGHFPEPESNGTAYFKIPIRR